MTAKVMCRRCDIHLEVPEYESRGICHRCGDKLILDLWNKPWNRLKLESANHEIENAMKKLEWVSHDSRHLASMDSSASYTPEEVLLELKDVQTILEFAEAKLKEAANDQDR